MLSLFATFARGRQLKADKLDALAHKYATLGWAYSRAQPESAEDADKARTHAVAGFLIADTAADGKRDFSDRQAGIYVDAAR